MLAYCDRDFDQPVVKIPPRFGAATPIRVAANAVMAGCKPEYFPLVLLALEAMAEGPYNLYGTQATTHPCTPMLIFNGRLRRKSASIRAITRWAITSAPTPRSDARCAWRWSTSARRYPAPGDMATAGTPAKFTFCVAENEAASPWETLHVERGLPRASSAVTVVAAEGPHNVNDHESLSPEGILTMIAGTMAITGSNNAYYAGQPVLAFGPEHAATAASGGMSKAQVKRWLFDRATIPMSKFSNEGIERRFRRKLADQFANAPLDTRWCLRSERHGRWRLGSGRGEGQQWTLNVDAGTASFHEEGHSQLRPMQPRLNVEAMADEVAQLITTGQLDPRLRR
jgi:hypothetical protein